MVLDIGQPSDAHVAAREFFTMGDTTRSVGLRSLIWAIRGSSSRWPGMCMAP